MSDMHDGQGPILDKMLTGQCEPVCCGHYTDAQGRTWHRCTLWVGVCLCEALRGYPVANVGQRWRPDASHEDPH